MRKFKESAVNRCNKSRHAVTHRQPDQSAAQADQAAELHEMPKHLGVGIAQGFQRADDAALLIDQPRHQHIQHHRGHRQKDHRHHLREYTEAADFVAQESVRRLIFARRGGKYAVVGQEIFRTLQNFLRPIAPRRGQHPHNLICGAIHVEHFFGVTLLQIEHAEMFRIGRQAAGAYQVDKLAGDCRADDEQFLAAIVHEQMNPLPWVQSVFAGERVVHQHFVAPAVGEIAAAQQHDVVDDRPAPIGERQHHAVQRLLRAL